MSNWKRATAIVAASGAVALGIALLSPPGGAHAECSPNGAMVIVPGTGDLNYFDTNEQTLGSMAAAQARAKNEGKDVIIVGYPTTLWPAGAVGYNKDVKIGTQQTKDAIAEYQSKCPVNAGDSASKKGHIEVFGYSQGARVAGDVLSDIGNNRATGTTKDGDEVALTMDGVTGTLVSDPRQGALANLAPGIERSFLGVIPGLNMSGARDGGFGGLGGLDDDGNPRVRSLCSQGDPICYLADPVKDPLGAIDGLLGYFLKHGDYVFSMQGNKHWMGMDPATWGTINGGGGRPADAINGTGSAECGMVANNGGNVCVVKQDSSVTRLVRQVAVQLGLSPADALKIPDLYGKVQSVLNLNGVLPGIGIASLQPVFDLVFKALPQLPYVSYNAGGYLPDAFTFVDLFTGVGAAIGGDTSVFTNAAKGLGLSIASILLVPVNGTIYWTNKASTLLTGSNVLTGGFVDRIHSLGQIPAQSNFPNTIFQWWTPPAPDPLSTTAGSDSSVTLQTFQASAAEAERVVAGLPEVPQGQTLAGSRTRRSGADAAGIERVRKHSPSWPTSRDYSKREPRQFVAPVTPQQAPVVPPAPPVDGGPQGDGATDRTVSPPALKSFKRWGIGSGAGNDGGAGAGTGGGDGATGSSGNPPFGAGAPGVRSRHRGGQGFAGKGFGGQGFGGQGFSGRSGM